MALIRPDWQLSEAQVTPETVFLNRRRFLKNAAKGAAGIGLGLSGAIALGSCQRSLDDQAKAEFEATLGNPLKGFKPNQAFQDLANAVTNQQYASRFNNFYEFGSTKDIWQKAQALPTDNWTLTVSGLVKNPKTYDLDDLRRSFPLEERIYRFRCVEAWAMVVPWLGFPMQALLSAVEPTAEAKFVRFESFFDPAITPGPLLAVSSLPWPYQEGLRIEEMANELAFFAVGVYGKTLPKQHGAPIRMVIPWKYGFKGAKSLVKIEFLAQQPATYWNTLSPNEYDFEANVNPNVPHPRWSQATERLMGPGSQWNWERQPTLLYNGYGDSVAQLYS